MKKCRRNRDMNVKEKLMFMIVEIRTIDINCTCQI